MEYAGFGAFHLHRVSRYPKPEHVRSLAEVEDMMQSTFYDFVVGFNLHLEVEDYRWNSSRLSYQMVASPLSIINLFST